MRILPLSLLLLAFALLVAACSNPTPTPSPTATPQATATPTEEPSEISPEIGAQLAQQMGCAACHSPTGGSSVGPTWQGLFGKERPLADGSTVVADETYLRESIVSPNAKIAEGFGAGIMPQNFGDRLSDAEITSIIEYIKTLQ